MRDKSGLADLLGLTTKELTFITYKLRNGRYLETKIKKKKGGFRTINNSHPILKSSQRKVLRLLEEFYKAPASAHGFVNQKSILTNSAQHINKKCVLNFDLKDFFPSINYGRVYKLLNSRAFMLGNESSSTLAALICNNNELPQGAPTSPLISNMICYRMDKELIRFSKIHGVSYSRYADDITISTNKNAFPKNIVSSNNYEKIELGKDIVNIVKTNGFNIHPEKTRLYCTNKSKYVTGIKVNTKQNLDRRYIRNVRAVLNKIEKGNIDAVNLDFKNKYNFRHGSKNIITTLEGRIEHIRNVKGYFDPVYRKLWNRLVRITGTGVLLPAEEIDQLHSKIFVVVGRGTGSGFVIGNNLITCKHVVVTKTKTESHGEYLNDDPLEEIEFFTKENFSSQSRLKAHNPKIIPELDMVIYKFTGLHGPSIEHQFTKGDSDVIKSGDSVRAFGFANYKSGNMCDYVEAKVSSIEKNKYDYREFNLDRPLYGGMSGGPILNLKNEVIGVIARGVKLREANNYEFTSVFLPINDVAKIIKKADEDSANIKKELI